MTASARIEDVLENRARWVVSHGDNLEIMRAMPDACIDAIVTDPPAGIAFMAKSWDSDKGGRDRWIAWLAGVMREALRVCKPGAHALVWALPRTSGWAQMALEDAGWEVRDCVYHLFASGFPKSHNVSKAIDRHNGDKRPITGPDPYETRRNREADKFQGTYGSIDAIGRTCPATSAGSSASAAWDGWGTALKPAAECWWLARKPLDGTIAENVLANGTGAINIDACRIGHATQADFDAHAKGVEAIKSRGGVMADSWKNSSDLAGANDVTPAGRWPAHLVLSHSPECQVVGDTVRVRPVYGNTDGRTTVGFAGGGMRSARAEVYECVSDCPVKLLDDQSGERRSAPAVLRNGGGGKINAGLSDRDVRGYGVAQPDQGYTDSGGASRFFFQAKPSRSEREFGLEEAEAEKVNDGRESAIDNAYQRGETKRRNVHPTVKSLALMRWLCRLIVPPGGILLDPFSGSGSTLIAARREGFRAVGIDQWDKAVEIARNRVVRWEQVRPDLDDADVAKAAEKTDPSQTTLFASSK